MSERLNDSAQVPGDIMKFVRILTVGMIGEIAFWSWCFLPSPPIPADALSHVTQKAVFRTLESDSFPNGEVSAIGSRLQESEERGEAGDRSEAEMTLRHKVELLARGLTFLDTIGDYSAELRKQEVVHGDLLDEQSISIKYRDKPFSIYLLWLRGNVGREVLYIEGANNGKMIAHDGGWKARIPAFSLSTDSAFAMRDTRHPVTKAGLRGLIEILDGIHQHDLSHQNFESCELDSQGQVDGRPCHMFTTQYKSAIVSPVYRKSITWIDREWNVPLQSRHFEWPTRASPIAAEQLDEATLIESYSYTDIAFERELTDDDFDRNNPNYRFR